MKLDGHDEPRRAFDAEWDAARLRTVLQAIPDLWFVIDGTGRYLECSDAEHPSLVVPYAELHGQEFGRGLPDSLAGLGRAAMRQAIGSGKVQRFEYDLECSDGVRRGFEARVSPMGNGQALYITRDVTELRKLEREALSLQGARAAEDGARSEDLYRSVAAAIGDGIQVVAADGTILATNPAACEMLGVEAQNLVGSRPSSLGFRLLFEDGSAVTDGEHPVETVRNGGPSQVDRVHLLARPDGTQSLIRLSVRPLHARGPELPRACLATFRDITTRRAVEHALRDKQAAELASRTKSEFLSRVSHEMRTPLNAVIGFTQLLRLAPEGVRPAQVNEFTDHVLRASQHLLMLINDLLDLQRVDEGRLALQCGPLAMRALVETTFSLLQPLARQHGVTLRHEIGPGAWATADAQRTRQVLLNIVSNAIKYNRADGQVRIHVLPSECQHLVIAVEDTGRGLSEAQRARLFQPFERLGQESTDIEGTGLGLVIARGLVEAMGGELTLGAGSPSGTVVRIVLPSAQPPSGVVVEPLATGTPALAAQPSTAALRMLYVEDNRINAILFEEAMRMHGGIDLRVAEDGTAALALVSDWPPEVLVLDANLPDMSGYDVLARLRELPGLAAVPAYMCSADAMEDDLQRARAAGFVGYWTKPINVERVMADLRGLLPASPGGTS